MRQAITWHSTADAGEVASRNTVTRGVGGATRALLTVTQKTRPLHVFTEEPGDRLGEAGIGTASAEGSGGAGGAFALELLEQ